MLHFDQMSHITFNFILYLIMKIGLMSHLSHTAHFISYHICFGSLLPIGMPRIKYVDLY